MNSRFFASDNCSGIHPQIMDAIVEVNHGHVKGYGHDHITEKAISDIKQIFGNQAEVFFVFSGTGANVIGLQGCLRSYEAIICSDVAHIHTDEAGAPERFLQSKLITIPSINGKINANQIKPLLIGRGVEHHVQPKLISITQSTEYGTIYSIEEIKAITNIAKEENLYVHMDGARVSNAAAALGKSPIEFTKEAGIDVMSFGGTKNGMMMGEAVIFLNPDLAKSTMYQRKQNAQLASKMRFISAQFSAFFKDDLWLNMAVHSNRMAKALEKSLLKFKEIIITQPVEVNAIFAIFPPQIIPLLQEEFPFYVWNEFTNEVRLMCSWDTTQQDIDAFSLKVEQLINKHL
jgi:threonine aldolase